MTDIDFYASCGLDMIGHEIGAAIKADPNGQSARTCFTHFDTHGKIIPCREPEEFARLLRAKKSVNLQIKLWAEDVASGLLTQKELIDYTHRWPDWVLRAVFNQAARICQKQIGFVPRFARLGYVKNTIQPPEMDSFNPNI